ncbi:MAG: transketolase family protein [Candidatus Omnitrophica bacterium]|nr:transketolase family protein [Candidatus Omnitrophota bacterium]
MEQKKATRDAFGEAILRMGRENEDIVVLSADLEDSTRTESFKNEFPERFFNLGIAEQDLLGTAAGLSMEGLIPFACSFAVFITNQAYGILRISICYDNRNVKIIGSHAGITVGPDGATAQCLEDLAITRVLPNLTVLSPCDAVEATKATEAMAGIRGPVYMRLGRTAFPVITAERDAFEIGKANVMREGKDVAVLATGLMVSESLKAARMLSEEGIEARVINIHTVKPIDEDEIIRAARETAAVVTAEEHQVHGGLGSAVAEVLACHSPVPVEMIAVRDIFGESGQPEELLAKYHLTDTDIAEACRRVLRRKKEIG